MEATSIQPYGIIVETEDGVAGFVTKEQARGVDCVEGEKYSATVLDIDIVKGVLDVSLLKSSSKVKTKKPKAGKPLDATIELVKADYLVLRLETKGLAFAATKSYNDIRPPFKRFKAGQKVEFTPFKSSKSEERVLGAIKVTDKSEDSSAAVLSSLEDVKEGSVLKGKVCLFSALIPGSRAADAEADVCSFPLDFQHREHADESRLWPEAQGSGSHYRG